ncbi:MAG TPA: GntR family transcriptional regulator [Aldersonia sp.]
MTPRYFEVKLALSRLIDGRELGDALPPERILAQKLGTSRTTLRKALAELEAEGKLRRTQGSGTFVAPPKLVQVRQLTSLTDDIGEAGRSLDSRVLELDRVAAHAEVAERLEIAAGERVYRLARLRLVDGDPLAYEIAWLPGELPDFARRLARHGSLYTSLREEYGRELDEVEDSVETALASPAEAELLGIGSGQPVLLIHRLGRDAHDRPIEWTRSVYRGDRFRFVARSRRERSGVV